MANEYNTYLICAVYKPKRVEMLIEARSLKEAVAKFTRKHPKAHIEKINLDFVVGKTICCKLPVLKTTKDQYESLGTGMFKCHNPADCKKGR